eukprot:gene29628-38751_t
MKDYPKPNVENTDNYRASEKLSSKFQDIRKLGGPSKTVAIIGGGLSGLACAKYLVDAGHKPVVYEARDVLGGKMIFAMQELPGEFTTFDFIPGIPAPFNFGLAILSNQKMLTLWEKLQTAPPLLPMLLEGQPFIDEQDELSVTQFMRKFGMPERINEEVFVAMAKALDFIDPDNGLQMAFLDGNQPDRICAPMKEYIEARGGQVRTSVPVKIVTSEDGSVSHLLLRNGEKIVADEYISAMPVDIMKRSGLH